MPGLAAAPPLTQSTSHSMAGGEDWEHKFLIMPEACAGAHGLLNLEWWEACIFASASLFGANMPVHQLSLRP